ncbi:STAS-like domain-containing protein [Methylobacterium sp. M6A4_1b]
MSVAEKRDTPTRTHIIKIASDFTRTPGGRSGRNGSFNGVEFRTRWLEPALRDAVATNERVVVDLDGVDTYIGSFLEEVFGGLLRGMFDSYAEAMQRLEIRGTGEFEVFRDLALEYMREEDAKKPKRR